MLQKFNSKYTTHPVYINFLSSSTQDLEKVTWNFLDSLTDEETLVSSCHPKLKTLDTEQAIKLMEEILLHRRWKLPNEKPSGQDASLGCIWNVCQRQTVFLQAMIQKDLKLRLQEVFDTTLLETEDLFLDRWDAFRSRNPEDYLLYWYCNRKFPQEIERSCLDDIQLKLEEQMAALQEEAQQLSEDTSAANREWRLELCNFRRRIRCKQLEEIESLQKNFFVCDQEPDAHGADPEATLSVVLTHPPQWSSMSKLTEQLEVVKFHMRSGTLSDTTKPSQSDLLAAYDDLLEELNRRIMAMVNHYAASHPSSGAVMEDTVRNQGEIRFVASFLEGHRLEYPEELRCCWYLNECFPHNMPLIKLRAVEEALNQQLAALDAEQVHDPSCRTSGLWLLRYHLREQQLEQIQEEISLVQSEQEEFLDYQSVQEEIYDIQPKEEKISGDQSTKKTGIYGISG